MQNWQKEIAAVWGLEDRDMLFGDEICRGHVFKMWNFVRLDVLGCRLYHNFLQLFSPIGSFRLLQIKQHEI
jgi:hypothetical protein